MANYTDYRNTNDVNRLIGARVMFKSLPINLLKIVKNYYRDQFTIKSIHFKTTEFGSNTVLIELNELPGTLINHTLLELLDYIPGVEDDLSAICGTFLCCQVVCGKGTVNNEDEEGNQGSGDYDDIIVNDTEVLSSILEKFIKEKN